MNTVQVNSFVRWLPSNWNELSKEQLLLVADLFQKGISIVDFRVKLIFSFLKIKKNLFHRISPADAYFVSQTLDFLFKGCSLTRNIIPKIGRYYGPEDSLKNITFEEFIKVSVCYDLYNATKQNTYLDEISAVLYRPRKFAWWIRRYFLENTDRRRKFLDRTYQKRLQAFSKVDQSVKYSVLLFILGVFNSLPERFPNVYRKKGDKTDEENKTGWIDILITLADGKTDDQNLQRIYQSNMYNVFYGLEFNAKQYFKMMNDHPELYKKT